MVKDFYRLGEGEITELTMDMAKLRERLSACHIRMTAESQKLADAKVNLPCALLMNATL